MNNFVEGSVVICGSSQAGSVVQLTNKDIWVLLRNGDIWIGSSHHCRFPQDQADLDTAPIDVDRLEVRPVTRIRE